MTEQVVADQVVIEYSYGGPWYILEGPMSQELVEGHLKQLAWGGGAEYRSTPVTPEEAILVQDALSKAGSNPVRLERKTSS